MASAPRGTMEKQKSKRGSKIEAARPKAPVEREAEARYVPPDFTGERAVCDILDEILDRTMEAAAAKALDGIAPAFTSVCLLHSLQVVLAWGDLSHDSPGDWATLGPPEEPSPGEHDRWARGALVSKTKPRQIELPVSPPELATSTAPNSARSTVSRGKRRKQPGTPGKGNSNSVPEPIMFNINEEEKKVDLDNLEGYAWPRSDDRDKASSVEDEASVADKQRLADEDEVFRKRVHAIKAKGKKWTLLPDGSICEIQALEKPERLGTVPPHYAVRTGRRRGPDGGPPPTQLSTKARQKKQKRQRAEPRARREAPRPRFRVSPLEQPSLAGGEDGFGCANGVTVTQGALTLAGGPCVGDGEHWSRAEYDSVRSANSCDESGAGGSWGNDDRAGYASSLDGASSEWSPATSPAKRTSAPGGSASSTRSLDARLQRGADAAPRAGALPGTPGDPFAGGHRLLGSASEPTLSAKTPEGEDPNVKLVRAADWGAVGPIREPVVGRMHTRQSSRQRARTFEHGAARARAARVRVAAAPPTRALTTYAVPPPGVSEMALHVFDTDMQSYASAGSHTSASLVLPKINA